VSKRKILVFAHVPPPHHGQSVMVQVMLEGLRADARFEVHHVDARVSDDLEDVGANCLSPSSIRQIKIKGSLSPISPDPCLKQLTDSSVKWRGQQ
jgi:hypothetical protein